MSDVKPNRSPLQDIIRIVLGAVLVVLGAVGWIRGELSPWFAAAFALIGIGTIWRILRSRD
jgi:hypothetical protein